MSKELYEDIKEYYEDNGEVYYSYWRPQTIDKILGLMKSWGYENPRYHDGVFRYSIKPDQYVLVTLSYLSTPRKFGVKLIEKGLPEDYEVAMKIQRQITAGLMQAEALNKVIRDLQVKRA